MPDRRTTLYRWRERNRLRRSDGETNGAADARPDETGAVDRLRLALANVTSPQEAASLLFDEIFALPRIDAVLLALLDENAKWATGFAARGADESWWRGIALDLEQGTSGMAAAARERTAFAVYDVPSAPNVSRRLADFVGAQSAAFVPLATEDRLVGVAVVASTREKRFFSALELDLIQQLADAAAVVIDKTRSTDELRRSLERERLTAEIARKVRSELDLDDVLEVAVRETGRALEVARCFIRLGGEGELMAVRAEWAAEGVEPIAVPPERLPVSNLALRTRRTVAIGDVVNASELDDPALGGRETLLSLGSRAVLATPIEIFDQVIGIFALHRAETCTWSVNEISVTEAIAGEVGLAIHTARLLEEDERRLGQQAALIKAAQVVTSDLRLESVLERLVQEVATLFEADAADCWMLEPGEEMLFCRAVVGLPEAEELGRRLPTEGTFAAAIRSGKPVLKRDFARTEHPPPSKNFADFEDVMVAPMTWLGEVRGVLGVCSRRAGHFQTSELELLDAFARFASLAAQNAGSFEERERQAQIQQGFYRIAEVLGSPLSLAETLDALAQAAAEALGGDSAVVLEPKGDALCLAGSYEVPDALRERLRQGLSAAATPFLAAAQEERIVSSTGLTDDERFDDETRALLRNEGYESLLCAPVQRGESENGAAVVLFRSEAAFSDDDLALARHLSGAARGALERSELYEQERHARSLSQRLASLGARLVSNLDPRLVLDEVAKEAPVLVDGDAAAVRLLEGEELVVRAATGAGTAGLAGTRASSGAGLLGEVAQSRQPATAEDARSEPQVGRGDPLLAEAMAACVAVPIASHGGGLYGVLSVYGETPRTWRPDEVQALVALGAMTSAALANAELYQRVADEKERSEAILGNIADGIVAVDRDDRIVLWNAMAERISGVPAAEALGRRVVEALQRDLASEDEESAGERQVTIVRGGKEVWLSLTEAVMRDATGGVAGRVFAFRDISGERAVEEMKSDFVATVSHELRTPLTSIYGFAETLLRRDVAFGEEDRATFLGYIATESERLISIVDDLLSVARLDAGTMGVSLAPVDVGAVVSEAVGRFGSDGEGRHEFVLDLGGSLEATADPARLDEVVTHLVDNAVKFSPAGGKIVVSGRRKSDTIEVRVVDEGLGIPTGEQPRIFSKFVRGETGPGAPTEGTGIGLFLARGFLAAMNGRIWLESEEGKGSSFVFELPVSDTA
ncbi:MAG: GAF domain-containing protein [Actinobacteria bacterium]|nr:GAF domain-containing protein [Actinomycetota bacterium]